MVIHNIAVGTLFYIIVVNQIVWVIFRAISCIGNCLARCLAFYSGSFPVQEIPHVCKLGLGRQDYASAYGLHRVGIVRPALGTGGRFPAQFRAVFRWTPRFAAINRPLNREIKFPYLLFCSLWFCLSLYHLHVCGNIYIIQNAADRKICILLFFSHCCV